MTDEPVLPWPMWERATDATLPPGVFEFRYSDGRRYRFPLIEFMVNPDTD